MFSINHQVGIKAPIEQVYELLTTNEGLSQWWTNDVTGAAGVGSTIAFRFNGQGPDFVVSELRPNELVGWQHSGDMPSEWMQTEIKFQLRRQDGQTFVRFTHSQWRETTDFMAHCSTKWGTFLMSLKAALETGKGRPFPNDIHIDHS